MARVQARENNSKLGQDPTNSDEICNNTVYRARSRSLPTLSDVIRRCPQFCLIVFGMGALGLPAQAQRGIGMGRRGPGNIVREQGIVAPKLVHPVNLLIEHRQDLALSDSQFKHLILLKRTLDSSDAPMLRKIDSVQRLFRGGLVFGEQSREHRDSVAEGRTVVLEMTAALRDRYALAKERAFAMLNAQQYDKAQELHAKAERAIQDEERKTTKSGGVFGRPPS